MNEVDYNLPHSVDNHIQENWRI